MLLLYVKIVKQKFNYILSTKSKLTTKTKTFTIDINGWHSVCWAETKEDALNIFMRRSKNSPEVYEAIRTMLAEHIKEKK